MPLPKNRTPGNIFEIQFPTGYFSYLQVLNSGVVVFNHRSQMRTEDLMKINEYRSLFFIQVYDYALSINKNPRWKKIGWLPVRSEFETVPLTFIQDALKPEIFSLYNPNTGEISPAIKKECAGLERTAVWEPYHVEERITAYFEGRVYDFVQKDVELFKDTMRSPPNEDPL